MKTSEFIKALKDMLNEVEDTDGETVEEKVEEKSDETVAEVTEEKKTDETEGGDEVVRTEVETTTINKETGVETIENKITFKDGAYYGI